MIGALFGGFFEIVKKPALLLPGLIVSIIMIGLLSFAEPTIQGVLFDLVLNEAVPKASIQELPYLLLTIYPVEIAILAVVGFVLLVAGNWLAFCFGNYFSKKKKSLSKAAGFATANIANAFYLAIFDVLVFGFFFAVFLVFSAVGSLNSWLGIILGIIFFILALLAYLVLLFLPSVLAIEEENVKESLKKSSEFVRKRVVPAIVFVFIVGLVYSLVSNIGSNIADGIESEELSFIVDFVFLLIAITYAGIAVPLYYVSLQK